MSPKYWSIILALTEFQTSQCFRVRFFRLCMPTKIHVFTLSLSPPARIKPYENKNFLV